MIDFGCLLKIVGTPILQPMIANVMNYFMFINLLYNFI